MNPKKALLFFIVLICSFSPSQGQAVSGPTLKHLILADTEEVALELKPQADDGGVIVKGVPLLQTNEFSASMESFVGKPITNESINAIAIAVHQYIKKMDRLILNVRVPKNQNPADGTLRMVITLGRYKDLIFQGNKYFSNELLKNKLGIRTGDEVRLSTLEEAINWTNNNPFRRVKVFINDLKATDPGKAELIVAVQEVLPLKLGISYDNSGSKILGENHYSASVQYGNLWGKDHIATYQFTTTDRLKLFQAHSLDYRIPLPWRHNLQIQGAYAQVNPSLLDGDFNQKGESILSSLRYLIPLEFKGVSLEFSVGGDFKESNNNLEYGGVEIRNKNDVFQGALGFTAMRRDTLGGWSLGAAVNLSPGDINSRNTDESYGSAHVLANSMYVTGIFSLQRLTLLPLGMQSVFSGTIQRSSTNLIGTEQMTIGGTGTVRGYPERVLAGDQGVVFNMELHGPSFKAPLAKILPKLQAPLETRPLVFFDYGNVVYKHSITSDLPTQAFASAGVGLRCSLGYRFNMTLDYGWQLRETREVYHISERGRGHIRVSMAY